MSRSQNKKYLLVVLIFYADKIQWWAIQIFADI